MGSEHIYDEVNSDIPYIRQSAALRSLAPSASSLLDLGCGTGRHLEILARDIPVCVGVDKNAYMARTTKGRVPGAGVVQGDMSRVAFDRQFDLVISLFAAVGYLDPVKLRRMLALCRRHLADGGVVAIEPWVLREGYRVKVWHVKVGEYEVTSNNTRQGNWSVMEKSYRHASGEISRCTERLYLHRDSHYRGAFAAAGLRVERLGFPDGTFRALYLGYV